MDRCNIPGARSVYMAKTIIGGNKMNSGIKATLCTTLAFAVLAGFVTACSKDLTGSNRDSNTGSTTQAGIDLVTKLPDYVSAKDASGSLPERGSIGGYEYSILGSEAYRAKEKDRGYYIDMLEEENSPYFFVICSGVKNTGGYDIKIVDIGMDGETLIITVEETTPGIDAIVTQALDYPYCVLKTDKMPSSFKIVDVQGYEYKDIGD